MKSERSITTEGTERTEEEVDPGEFKGYTSVSSVFSVVKKSPASLREACFWSHTEPRSHEGKRFLQKGSSLCSSCLCVSRFRLRFFCVYLRIKGG